MGGGEEKGPTTMFRTQLRIREEIARPGGKKLAKTRGHFNGDMGRSRPETGGKVRLSHLRKDQRDIGREREGRNAAKKTGAVGGNRGLGKGH